MNDAPETMAGFFDARAAGYDQPIRGYVFDEETFARFYQTVAAPIEHTDQPVRVLDLGCGTGLEIASILARAPNARVTGVDVSSNMLDLLCRHYAPQMDQITLVTDSYLTIPLETHAYDYAVSVMTAHHLLHDAKVTLYRKIARPWCRGASISKGIQ